jgi:hypothetical protein
MGGAQMAGGPMMGAPPAPAKKNNTVLIVVIVIVVVVGLVIAGTLLALNAFNNTVNQTSDVSMTVTGTHTPTSSEYTVAPAAGKTYFQVTVSMTNNGDIPTMVSGMLFELQASGIKYPYTPLVTSDTDSDTILVDETITFNVSFEIPTSATPQKIFYNPILGHQVSANI